MVTGFRGAVGECRLSLTWPMLSRQQVPSLESIDSFRAVSGMDFSRVGRGRGLARLAAQTGSGAPIEVNEEGILGPIWRVPGPLGGIVLRRGYWLPGGHPRGLLRSSRGATDRPPR